MFIQKLRTTFLAIALSLSFLSTLTVAQDNSSALQMYNQDLGFTTSNLFRFSNIVDPLGLQLLRASYPFEESFDFENYVLGVNDLISVSIRANESILLRGLIVNPQGEIVVPVFGAIPVEGKTIREAELDILKYASEQLSDPEISITLETPRPSVIHISGSVPHPGKYIIPSKSRLDQAIFSSLTDGNRNPGNSIVNSSEILSGNFSFRNIEIVSEDGSIVYGDLINYFRTGDLAANPVIRDGDLINITRLNREAPKISISGAVKSDYEIEFKQGDTPLTLLAIGGGFDVIADTTKLLLYRNNDEGIQKIEVARDDWNTFQLMPNDRLIALQGEYFDPSASAWVNGEVEIPGNFPIKSGQTSAFDLLDLAGGLTEKALPGAAYLIRGGERNGIPNQFNTEMMKRTSDQVVQGLEYLDAETQLSQNRVFIDLSNEEQLRSLVLLDGDRLYVPRDANTVFVFGQVNNPGYFPFMNNRKSVSEYISDAGGFALSADLERIFILKAGNSTWYRVGETNLESGDRIFVDRQPVEELNALRAYEIQKQQLKNQRTQLIMTGITTVTGIITTLVAIGVIN